MKIFEITLTASGSKYWVFAPTEEIATTVLVSEDYADAEDHYTATEIPRDEWKNHNVVNYAFDSELYDDACDVPEREWLDGIPPEMTFEEAVEGMTTPSVFCSTEFEGM